MVSVGKLRAKCDVGTGSLFLQVVISQSIQDGQSTELETGSYMMDDTM